MPLIKKLDVTHLFSINLSELFDGKKNLGLKTGDVFNSILNQM